MIRQSILYHIFFINQQSSGSAKTTVRGSAKIADFLASIPEYTAR